MNSRVSLACVVVMLVASCASKHSEVSVGAVPDYSVIEVTLGDYNHSYADSFWDVPPLPRAFFTTNPENRNDGISVANMTRNATVRDSLALLAKEIAADNEENYDSLLVLHEGKLVFEAYFLSGRVNLPHPQASATKTYTSLVLGRAIQLGYLSMGDLDRPLDSFLNELDPSAFAEGAGQISLREALTMTTGIRLEDAQWDHMRENPEQMQGQEQVQYILESTQPVTAKSKAFSYGTGPDLVMQVVEAIVPGGAELFIKTQLLDKLGILEYEWPKEVNGLPVAGWQTSITSRDMVKLGLLTMNRGKWNGEQLISETYIDEAIRPSVFPGDDDIYGGGPDVSKIGYGFFWWTADLQSGGNTYFVSNAQGGGGQYIILIDELDLIVVVTGHSNDNTTLQRVAERIIPAFIE